MKMITYLCLASIQVFVEFLSIEAAPDNRGSEFIIGYMENTGYGSSAPLNPELYITTTRTTTVNVQVQAPLYTTSTIDETVSVTAGVVEKLSFDSGIRVTGTSLSNNGIWVNADNEIIIYGVSPETYSNDAFLGLPVDVIGTDYYVITWHPATNQCELLVVGVNDSTTVNIALGAALGSSTVTWGGTDYHSGDTITININRYQTLQLTSDGDLTGSHITSDKIVSVFSGNKKTTVDTGPSSDHLVEQWPPVSTFGKTFATVPVPGRTVGDKFKFVASEDNTQVNITANGYFTSFTLSLAGSQEEKDLQSDYYCYVQANKPILVAQFCKSQTSYGASEKSDPMMTMIPPIELFAADYTFATPQYSQTGSYTNYFMFVVKDSERSGLRIDGSAFSASTVYNSFPGTDLVGGYIEVSEGTHQVRHTSTTSVFGGYLFGTAEYETYGFPTGSRFAQINSVCVATTNVIGDGIDNDCDGLIDEEACSNGNVDGNWTDWGAWSSCSVTCSENGGSVSGTTTRTRTCTNPAPQYDGAQCSGTDSETSSCSTSSECQETTTVGETTSTETATTTSTTDSTTVTVETTTVSTTKETTTSAELTTTTNIQTTSEGTDTSTETTSTADTTQASTSEATNTVETTLSSTSATTSIVDTTQTAGDSETTSILETTTDFSETTQASTSETSSTEGTTQSSASTTIVDTTQTSTSETTSSIETTQTSTLAESNDTSTVTSTTRASSTETPVAQASSSSSTGIFNEIVLSGIIAASIVGPCCALSLLCALRRRLLKFKRKVKPKEAFIDDFDGQDDVSEESPYVHNESWSKPSKISVRDPLDF